MFISISQSSSTEVMSIRAARCYDLESRAIIFGNGQPCTLENMKAVGQGRYCELMYEFCHNMASARTDNAEYAIFTAICIFSGLYIVSLRQVIYFNKVACLFYFFHEGLCS